MDISFTSGGELYISCAGEPERVRDELARVAELYCPDEITPRVEADAIIAPVERGTRIDQVRLMADLSLRTVIAHRGAAS